MQTRKYCVRLTQMFHNLGAPNDILWQNLISFCVWKKAGFCIQERLSKNYELNYRPKDGSQF